MPRITLASGLRLSYVRQGDAIDPAVLLLPGPTDSWRSYLPVLTHLPPDVHAVAVSQRGHGKSDKPDAGYRIEDFAEDVVLLLDALDLPQAILAGHSGSCLVARRVALDRPDRVAGLILEASPTTLRDDARLVDFVETVVVGLDDPIDPEFARAFIVQTSSTGIGQAIVDLLADDLLRVPARVWQETFSGLLRYDDLAELTRIDTPTLLVWGDADALVSRAMQDLLARSIRDAELVVYPGAGHTPRWDYPERFSSDVAAFARLRRV